VRWTGFLDRLTNNPLRTAPANPLEERAAALGPLSAATMPAPTASAAASSKKADAMANYVKERGGNTVIRKVLIANNGMAATKSILSMRQWAYMEVREQANGLKYLHGIAWRCVLPLLRPTDRPTD